AAAMRCAVGAGGVPIFSPTSQAQCRSAYVGVARHMADRRWSAATRKERLCCLNKDGKYNSIHKPTWITHICEEVVGHLPYHPSTRCC
uniref:Uncharacterized protein n=1 Tax=Aegilops tauschii subsp. strangulata TaxID=200361 RepID=A0A453AYS4_AEGTS